MINKPAATRPDASDNSMTEATSMMLVIMMMVVEMKIVMRKVRKQLPDVILLVKSNQGLGLTQLLPATEK